MSLAGCGLRVCCAPCSSALAPQMPCASNEWGAAVCAMLCNAPYPLSVRPCVHPYPMGPVQVGSCALCMHAHATRGLTHRSTTATPLHRRYAPSSAARISQTNPHVGGFHTPRQIFAEAAAAAARPQRDHVLTFLKNIANCVRVWDGRRCKWYGTPLLVNLEAYNTHPACCRCPLRLKIHSQ